MMDTDSLSEARSSRRTDKANVREMTAGYSISSRLKHLIINVLNLVSEFYYNKVKCNLCFCKAAAWTMTGDTLIQRRFGCHILLPATHLPLLLLTNNNPSIFCSPLFIFLKPQNRLSNNHDFCVRHILQCPHSAFGKQLSFSCIHARLTPASEGLTRTPLHWEWADVVCYLIGLRILCVE